MERKVQFRYVQGQDILTKAGVYISKLDDKALLFANEFVWGHCWKCSFSEIECVIDLSKKSASSLVISVGGGKTMDTAKAVANKLDVKLTTVQTTASTDTPTFAIPVIYTVQGVVERYQFYDKNPDLVPVETRVSADAYIKAMSLENETNLEDQEILEVPSPMATNHNQKNKENVTLIWFNPDMDKTNDNEKIQEDLRAENDFFLCPLSIELCIADIKSIKEEKTFLITGGSNAFRLLPNVVDLPLLDSVFIFPESSEEYGRLRDDYDKVVGIFDNVYDLIQSIRENTKHVNRQMEVISFYDERQRGTRDLSEQSSEFLWFRLFKDVIQHLPHDDKAKEEMLSACRQYYRDNRRILKDIQEFEDVYHEDDCIQWYTRDTFIYKLINKALRTEDIEQLYIFRYYIADLSKQLTVEYETMKNNDGSNIRLYRGTVINTKELASMTVNIGKPFAVNSYWSTSRNRSYALTFATKAMHRSDTAAIIYEIECDLQVQNDSVIFADISAASDFSTEEEVLFDAGSVFHIETIEKENEGDRELYTIKIRTTEEVRKLGQEYIEGNRQQMEQEGPRIMLSVLMKRMGNFQKSLQFLRDLLKNPDGENIAHIHNRIGIALKDDNQYKDALIHLKKAFNLTSHSNPPDKKYSAYVLHNQGLVYAKQKQFKKALKFYQRAVNILYEVTGDNNAGIAQFYNSIGRAYLYERNLEKALEYQLAGLYIRECVMSNHVMNAFSYADIANVYSVQANYDQALKYHLKALELREKFLLPNHYTTAWSLHQVGRTYYQMTNLQTARNYYLQSLQIYEKYIDTNLHYVLSHLHQDIAKTYRWQSQEAISHQLMALDIQIYLKPVSFSNLNRLLDDIAYTYKSMGRIEDLINFYEKALKIREKYLFSDKGKLARLLDDIAYNYRLVGKREDSLNYYGKALRIRQENFADDDFNLSYSFNHLASLYEEMGDMENALVYYNHALEIYHLHYHHRHRVCEKTRRNIQRIEQNLE